MTPEGRVEREAVAAVLAAHVLTLNSFLSVIGECECGDWKKGSLRQQDVETAHRLHQADAVLAALPQTGDAAAVARVEALADEWEARITAYMDRHLRAPRMDMGRAVTRLRAALTAGADQ